MKASNNIKIMALTLYSLVFLGSMNVIIFNVAFTKICLDLSIGPSRVSWIVIGYSMIASIGTLIYGKLADRFSLKGLLIIGISLFGAGSVLGFMNQSYGVIIAARLLQASGGSSFIPLSMISIVRILAPDKRPAALSMISAAIVISSGFGPLIGGWVTNALGWPYLFLIMWISFLAIVLLLKYMFEDKRENISVSYHFDVVGCLLLFITLASALLGVNVNKFFLIPAVIAIILCALWMRKYKYPFIDTELLRNTTYLRISAMAFVIYFSMASLLLLMPFLLEDKYGLSPSLVGIILFICSLFAAFSGFATGKFLSKFGGIKIVYGATFLMILGFILLLIFRNTGPLIIILPLILIYIGFSITQVSLNTLVPHSISKEKTGVGLGLYNLLSFMGMPFGPAVSSKLLEATGSYRFCFTSITVLICLQFALLFRLKLNTD